MKAYSVTTNDGECGCNIVFADSVGKAKALALTLDEFEDCKFTDIVAKRKPKLDGMENCEPRDNPWLNDEIRTILVKEYGWYCFEPTEEECKKCCCNEFCDYYEDYIKDVEEDE